MKKRIKKFIDNASEKIENFQRFNFNWLIPVAFSILLGIPLLTWFNKLFNEQNFKNEAGILIGVIAGSLAFAALLINYSNVFLKEDVAKNEIKRTIELFIVSILFPVFSLLYNFSGNKPGLLYKILAYFVVIGSILSILVFTFCLVRVFIYFLKSLFKK